MSDVADNASIDDSPEQSQSYPGISSSRRKHDDLVHAEIESLQRRFRQIEGQRKQSILHLANAKTPQLARLKDINSQARDDLRLETGKAHTMIRYSMGRRIGALQDEAELYHSKIARESHRLTILEKKIERQRAVLAEQKKIAVQTRQSKASVYRMEKRLLVDESKLDSALVKFSEAISQNKIMRESIDDLRRERATFDTLVQRNERELEENKKELAAMMDQTVRIFQEKARVANDLTQIKDEAVTELARIEDEWHSLVRVLTEDAEQLEAAMQEDMARAREKKYDKSIDQMAQESNRDQQVRQQLAAMDTKLRDHRNQIADAMLCVHSTEESLSKITKATGIATIEDVIDAFLKAENTNFYLFQQLSEINAQIESGEMEIAELLERQKQIQSGLTNLANQSKLQSVVDSVYENYHNAEARLQQYNTEISRHDDCMQVMKQSIEKLLQLLVGDKETVHNGNITDCLDRIENSTNRYVNLYLMTKRNSDADRVHLVNVPPLDNINIDPPSVAGTSVDDDPDAIGIVPGLRRDTSVGDEPTLRRIVSVDRLSLTNRNESSTGILGPLLRRNRTPV